VDSPVFQVLVGVLSPATQAWEKPCSGQPRVGSKDLDVRGILVGGKLADRCGVVAYEADHLVGDQGGASFPVDIHS